MINEIVFLLLHTLWRAEIAASGAIGLVFLIRRPARALVGSGLAYRLWALPVAAATASVFPTLPEMLNGPAASERAMAAFDVGRGHVRLAIWLCGAAAFLTVAIVSELRFRRLAAEGRAGPAVMGLGWHRLVMPADFHTRFTPAEREFILRHERTHIARRDPLANLLIALLQAASWFNPLAHVAAAYARLDQELACDEAVVGARPEIRRGYAETLVKAQLSRSTSPFACALTGDWGFALRHPLELRLSMLAQPRPGMVRYLLGGAAVAAMGLIMAAAVWAEVPEALGRQGLALQALVSLQGGAPPAVRSSSG